MKEGVPRILIVDDEPTLRTLLEVKLHIDLECEVVHAGSGNEAFQLILGQPFDIVISDFCMPDGSGLDLLDALRAAQVNVPMIIFTASSVDVLAPLIGAPLVAVISKPEVDSLLSCVHESLEVSA